MHRVRTVTADGIARRMTLLAENAKDPPATMTLRRRGRYLFVALENPGDLEDAHTIVHLAGETVRGGSGVRLILPDDFDSRPEGVPFSCGTEGRRLGRPGLRRWAGGVPEGLEHGTPGRLLPLESA